jgi:uncharacterized membrane protein
MVLAGSLFVAFFFAGGCSGSSSTGTTSSSSSGSTSGDTTSDDDDGTTCPSYVDTVAAIFVKNCTSCHAPGGKKAEIPLTTYEEVAAYAAKIQAAVNSGRMPPTGGLAASDKSSILSWISCGSPDN